MGFPLLGVLKLGEKVLKATGVIGKGKMTNTGIAGVVVGGVVTSVTGENPFDSAIKIIELMRDGWPHALIVVGALTTLAGYFRKAGAAGARAQSAGVK